MVPPEEALTGNRSQRGEVMLNVLGKNVLYRVDVARGNVIKKYSMTELMNRQLKLVREFGIMGYDRMNNVLNGIAYNKKRKSWFVTGKRWFQIYEIRLH